jgi:uncharacterized protein
MASEPDNPIFECRKCGECCKGYGGTFVTDADISAIAAYLNVSPERFVEVYCRMSGNKPILTQGENGYCIFWKKLCGIHPVKPRMCKAWPYIDCVVKAPENWQAMASCCPGMRTDTTEVTIVAAVSEILRVRYSEKNTDGSSSSK